MTATELLRLLRNYCKNGPSPALCCYFWTMNTIADYVETFGPQTPKNVSFKVTAVGFDPSSTDKGCYKWSRFTLPPFYGDSVPASVR